MCAHVIHSPFHSFRGQVKSAKPATQGFADEIESFLLDPELALVRDKAFCTTGRSS
jgi:hypothetical protein